MKPFCVILAVADPVLSPVSPQAEALAHLFVETLFVCAVIFAIVAALVILCIMRSRKMPDGSEPAQITGNRRLEISWTVASILIVMALFVMTVRAMRVSDPAPDKPPDLTVIGHQWWWEARYPNGAVAANEIHIPTGTDLLLRLESPDVIHDFWAPQLGRKMDIIPGHPNFVWIRADTAGKYLGACAEYCGAEHAWMRIVVDAQAPADYEKWLSQQQQPAPAPASPLARDGLRLFREKTCVNCHSISGVDTNTVVGPDLTQFASRSTLGAGVLENGPESVRTWLKNPQLVKPSCHMPDFQLTQSEVNALAEYLETMK
jgi:cytochrome c oxidase subunit II